MVMIPALKLFLNLPLHFILTFNTILFHRFAIHFLIIKKVQDVNLALLIHWVSLVEPSLYGIELATQTFVLELDQRSFL